MEDLVAGMNQPALWMKLPPACANSVRAAGHAPRQSDDDAALSRCSLLSIRNSPASANVIIQLTRAPFVPLF